METTKTCKTCGETKPISDFLTNGKHNGGYKASCRKCCAEKLREWRKANPERARARDRAWASKNKEKISIKNAMRYADPTLEKKLSLLFMTALKSYASRNIEFNITLDHLHDLWLSQNGLCAYIKLPLSCKAHQHNTVSLDRIDSTKGYIEGNVHLVGASLNRMKMNIPHQDFITLCHLVSQNNPVSDNSIDLAVNR